MMSCDEKDFYKGTNPIVSIVMPVYDTGEKLSVSLEGILHQTLENFELICVDDGSKNMKTLELLAEFEKKDERISVIHLNGNHGAAYARNTGFSSIRGAYVIFLDSDDIYEPNLLYEMSATLDRTEAEVCVCTYRIRSETEGRIVSVRRPRGKSGVTNRVFSSEELGKEALSFWNLCPWDIMCKRSFLEDYQIRFQEIRTYEDVQYAISCIMAAKRIVYCDYKGPLLTHRRGGPLQLTPWKGVTDYWKVFESWLFAPPVWLGKTEMTQMVYALVKTGIFRMNQINDEKEKKIFYAYVRDYFRKTAKSFLDSPEIAVWSKAFQTYSFESGWWKRFRYEMQLELNWTEIEKIFDASMKNVVWGLGRRGKAFLRVCRGHGIKGLFVTDRNLKSMKDGDMCGYIRMEVETVKKTKGIIIASNENIYGELTVMDIDARIYDLQQYCPVIDNAE